MSTEQEQAEDFVALYREAFDKYGSRALWSSRPVSNPGPGDGLAITHSLRVEGDMNARSLAERIERSCRHAVRPV